MKKVYFIIITLVIAMMAAASCTGAPKSKGDSPPTPTEIAPPPETAALPEPVGDEDDIDVDDIEDIGDIEDDEIADIDAEEPVLAEAEEEEEPPAEDDLLAEEPEPPAVAAVPEPEPPPPPPPPPAPTPPAEPRPATPPPTVTARPTPPPPTPRPATPTPPAATPAPPPTPPAETPAAVQPPPAAEPPAIAREPAPRDIPELPNPTPAFRGRLDDEVVFSRVVHAMVGQLVAIPFRGTGWVYLGETDSRKGIAYDSRRLDPEGQSFIFRTEAAGEYALKFYRQDFIRDFILNDYVQVIVGDPPETGWNPLIDRGRVVAEPRWPTSLEEARVLRGDTQPRDAAPAAPAPAPAPVRPPAQTAQQPPAQPPSAQPPQTPPQPRPQTPPPATPSPEQAPPEQPPLQIPDLEPDEYLKRAKEEFDAGRIAAAIAYLDRYHEFYPMDSDEVLWLYGQFYEANSPSRNILAALDCYRRLTREYPQSSRFDDARRRIAYLQRFYINIQ